MSNNQPGWIGATCLMNSLVVKASSKYCLNYFDTKSFTLHPWYSAIVRRNVAQCCLFGYFRLKSHLQLVLYTRRIHPIPFDKWVNSLPLKLAACEILMVRQLNRWNNCGRKLVYMTVLMGFREVVWAGVLYFQTTVNNKQKLCGRGERK